ncbi:hypothetical protein Tco_0949097 [Tanacetum coccineum]
MLLRTVDDNDDDNDDDDDKNAEEKKDDKKDDDKKKDDEHNDNDHHTDHTLTKRISSKYRHLPGALHRMCRRQGYMIQQMEKKYVTNREFWNFHGKVDKFLHEIIPQIASRAINDLIGNNLKRVVADSIIQEHEVPALISKEIADHAPKIIEELFNNYLKNNVIQFHPTTSASTSTTT